MDDVAVVDDMGAPAAALLRPAAPQGEDLRRAQKAVEPVVVEMDIETMADQPRGNAAASFQSHCTPAATQ
jgi:hypothetical protein